MYFVVVNHLKYIMKASNSGTGILFISHRMKTSGCSWKRPNHSTPGLRPKSWMLPFGLGRTTSIVSFKITLLPGGKLFLCKLVKSINWSCLQFLSGGFTIHSTACCAYAWSDPVRTFSPDVRTFSSQEQIDKSHVFVEKLLTHG